jgi:hypothetical protein
MPAKIARSTPRPSFGLPELPVAIHISRLASKDAAKSLLSTLVSESSGECRFIAAAPGYRQADRDPQIASAILNPDSRGLAPRCSREKTWKRTDGRRGTS